MALPGAFEGQYIYLPAGSTFFSNNTEIFVHKPLSKPVINYISVSQVMLFQMSFVLKM